MTLEFRRFVAWLVHANLIVATAALGVGLTSAAVVRLPVEPLPLGFVFLATWFGYTANRFTDRVEDQTNLPDRARFIDRYGRPLLGIAAVGYLGALVLVVRWEPWMVPLALIPVVVVGIYATPAATRYFAVKNGLVGLVWAAIPIGLGVYYGALSTPTLWIVGLAIFLLISAAAGVFDIKDIEGDRAVGSLTVPVLVGPNRTKQLAVLGVVLVLPLSLWGASVYDDRLLILLVYVGYLTLVIPFASVDRGPIYFGMVIDGEHILVAAVASLVWLF